MKRKFHFKGRTFRSHSKWSKNSTKTSLGSTLDPSAQLQAEITTKYLGPCSGSKERREREWPAGIMTGKTVRMPSRNLSGAFPRYRESARLELSE